MTNTTPLPLRNDTILGVCEAIGRDFGFNPLWLRLAFIVPLFFAPTLTIAAYFGLGALVGLVNYFSPDKPASGRSSMPGRRWSRPTKRCRWPRKYPQIFRARTLPSPLRARKCPETTRFLTCLTKV